MKIEMLYKKSTKNTHVYIENSKEGQNLTIPTLYVNKSQLPSAPKKLIIELMAKEHTEL